VYDEAIVSIITRPDSLVGRLHASGLQTSSQPATASALADGGADSNTATMAPAPSRT
jgi:hypothetical protein